MRWQWIGGLWILAVGAYGGEIGQAFELSPIFKPDGAFMGVRLLGALRLVSDPSHGSAVHDLSGLAWDQDEQVLYAVSDQGYLAHLYPKFTAGILTGVELRTTYSLRDGAGRPLKGRNADTEDLAIRNSTNGKRGDTELIVSFEQKPRVLGFQPNGAYLHAYPLPEPLSDINAYQDPKDALEALALHPEFGLLTAPMRPLVSAAQGVFTLYALDGRQWRYPSIDTQHSDLVSLETMPNGSLLALERKYEGFFRPVVFAVRRIQLTPGSKDGSMLPVQDIVRFDTSDGWAIDNFEAIAGHQGNRFFMVSDDNESAIQKTLLLYLEILESAGRDPQQGIH
jgi:hypothetical protein